MGLRHTTADENQISVRPRSILYEEQRYDSTNGRDLDDRQRSFGR